MNKGFFKELFREKKLRVSLPRFLIYQELSSSKVPLSPREIYEVLRRKKRKVGLTSIYRSLDLFESLGMAFRISRGSSVKFKSCELRNHHHHIVCQSCGKVVEFECCDLSEWSKWVGESTGYQVTDHQIHFLGLCHNCRPSQT